MIPVPPGSIEILPPRGGALLAYLVWRHWLDRGLARDAAGTEIWIAILVRRLVDLEFLRESEENSCRVVVLGEVVRDRRSLMIPSCMCICWWAVSMLATTPCKMSRLD
jgi:hypothetical protein